MFHSFALFVNITDLECRIGNDDLFTQSYNKDSFWPFVSFYETFHEKVPIESYNPALGYIDESHTYFKGIFYSYNITAFVFYIIIGFGVVYIPKLWKEQTVQV